MDKASFDAPVWVTRSSDLTRMAADLSQHTIVAVDTEANSLHAFREQVCLLQFSTEKTDYLVDPLALKDLSPLAPVFANPRIEKVFHAAEYDIIGLKRDFSFTFSNLFDTMIASRILGRSAVGLAAMLESELGIQIDKRYQRANWGQRPLPLALMDYARFDTHYLIQLRDHLHAALVENGYWALAQEDFHRLTLTAPGNHSDDHLENFWRVAGKEHLSPQQNAVLLELCAYRNRQAAAADLPLFKVLSNATLVHLAQVLPQTAAELDGIVGLSPRLIDRHGRALLQAIQRGLQAEPLERPRRERPDDAYLARLEGLRSWRKSAAQELKVESDVVLPKDILEAIAMRSPRDLETLAGIMQDLPWRFEHFGSQIIQTLRA